MATMTTGEVMTMDVTLVRRLLDETPMEDLKKYLEAYNSDAEKIQGMTGTEMLRYMAKYHIVTLT